MAGYIDNCGFLPTLGGTTDWTYSSAIASYQSPSAAGAVNAKVYRYYARSTDFTQWEIGYGAYNSGTGVFARTTVLFNSSGTGTATGQSGAGTKINFSTVPQVFVVALAEDLPSLSENNVFTGTISSTQFIINNAAPAYFLESAGGTIWGVLSHDGADLYLQNSLAGNIYFLRAGVAIHGLGPGSSSIYGATSGNVALSVPAVAGANTVSIQARTGTMALRDDFIAGRLFGLTLSTAGGSATFGIAVGLASDSTAADILSLGSAYTKTTGAWAVGTGNGSLDTGAIASGNLYNVFLIKRTDTGVVDVLTSLSATAPTMPTNYTLFRRIGAMRTLAGVVWAGFTQRGDNFYLSVDIDDAVGTTVGTSRVLITSKAPPSSRALIRAYAFNATTAGVGFLIQPTFETDRAPGANMSLLGEVANQGDPGHFDIPVDSSSQFAVRSQNAAGSFYCRTYGWVDDRGKLS